MERLPQYQQLILPYNTSTDAHTGLIYDGVSIFPGQGFLALFPDGWREITLEVNTGLPSPHDWFISTPGFLDICPIGLFVGTPDKRHLQPPPTNRVIAQIKLPALDDKSQCPRLLIDGAGTSCGRPLTALFPDGWHDITLEVNAAIQGPGCWHISTPSRRRISPIGLFVQV